MFLQNEDFSRNYQRFTLINAEFLLISFPINNNCCWTNFHHKLTYGGNHLGRLASIFRKSLRPRKICGETSRRKIGREVVFCLDREKMIRATMSPITTSKMVRGLKGTLNQADKNNRVLLVRVPGYEEIVGNEEEDWLTKQGPATRGVPVLQSLCDERIRSWVRFENASSWNAYNGGKHSKGFLPEPNEKWARELLGLSRSSMRRVVGAINAHCRLNKHLAGTDRRLALAGLMKRQGSTLSANVQYSSP